MLIFQDRTVPIEDILSAVQELYEQGKFEEASRISWFIM